MSDKFLNVEEARKLLRVSRVTLYRWITDGKLRANKVGGTYRIKQSDVDALIEGVPSTQSRDGEAGGRAPSRSPLDVTARDIEKWSEDNRLAQENLPELVRWLAQSASSAAGIDDLHIPSGDSVGKPGWDGMIKSNSGDRFIPAGTSAWEMGVGPSEAKAEKDFNKRTANPQNVEIKDTTFVFVTPKIWSNSNSWVKEKASSGWKNIKVIDADDLADWLEVSPAVKIKFLSRIGRNTKNLQDVETYWSEWSGETTPNFSTDLAISGRNESNKKLIDLVLRDKTKKLVTVAAGSKAEAVAFIVASMISCDEIDQALLLSNTLVVSSQEAWDEIIRTENHRLNLVPLFENAERINIAIQKGHTVLLPVDDNIASGEEDIALKRPMKANVMSALESIGVSGNEAEEKAKLGRHSISSLWRSMSSNPDIRKPSWVAEPQDIIPALLVGRWDESSEADKKLISEVAGLEYDVYKAKLEKFLSTPDSPIGKVGSKWYIVSKDDTWNLLKNFISAKFMQSFIKASSLVLEEIDPAFDMPYSDRWLANIEGKKMQYSGELRKSIADTLALLAVRFGVNKIGGIDAVDISKTVISGIFEKAANDNMGKLWGTLSDVIADLAEAAPEEFLLFLDQGIANKSIKFIFQDFQDDSSFGGNSPHTGYLWAIERIAWSEKYLLRASRALMKLHELDPGGKYANRPMASLVDIFLSWHPQTSADLKKRIEVLSEISRQYPDTSWDLILGTLPDTHGFTTGTNAPRWHSWKTEPKKATYQELNDHVDSVSPLLLEMVDSNPKHWEDLLEKFTSLSNNSRKQLIAKLHDFKVDELSDEARLIIWNAIRNFVYKNSRYAKTDWAVKKDDVDAVRPALKKFEPTKLPDRYSWLFGHHVDLPLDDEDWEAYEIKVSEKKIKAVKTIHAEGGLKSLLSLNKKVETPYYLGVSVGQSAVLSDEEMEEVLPALTNKDDIGRFARGVIIGRFNPNDWQWAERILKTSKILKDQNLLGHFLALLPNAKETWAFVDRMLEDESLYWANNDPHGIVDEKDFTFVAEKLIKHDRPIEAIEVISVHKDRDKDSKVDPDLVMRALEGSVRADLKKHNIQMFKYNVTKLLDLLYESDVAERTRIASVEWSLLPLLRFDWKPKILMDELSKDPSFFVEIMTWAFRERGSKRKKLTKDQEVKAKLAHELLDSWNVIPGKSDGGLINEKQLNDWVDKAREELREKNRLEVGDQMIGKVLSKSTEDSDGSWPKKEIRDLIERLASPDIETGFRLEVYNSRGMTSRAIGEGGSQERALADKYSKLAELINEKWPRASYTLLKIADTWRKEAERHDNDAIEEEIE